MTTIKYALREVRKYFGRYLPIYAQIITSVLLFAFIAVTFDQARVFSAKMYEYSEHKNTKSYTNIQLRMLKCIFI